MIVQLNWQLDFIIILLFILNQIFEPYGEHYTHIFLIVVYYIIAIA